MNLKRIKKLKNSIATPLLVKKKENLLYLTGRSFLNGYLLVKKDKAIFLGDGLEKAEGVRYVDRLKNIGKYLGSEKKIVLENVITYAEVEYLKAKVPGLQYKVVTSPVDKTRSVKTPAEIRDIGRSMKIVEKVFRQVKSTLRKKSWTEKALADFIKNTGMKLGAEDVSFDQIVATGRNAAVPQHLPSEKKIKHGESIILDMGFKHNNYCSDFTRTVFLKKFPRRLEIAYRQTELAYSRSLSSLAPGIKTSELYNIATRTLAEKNLDKYFVHNLGHGTGLEIHELPNLSPQSREKLEAGNVFSIEPGVYLPRTGGIRIEDLVYLRGKQVRKFIFVSTKLEDNIL